VVRRCCAAVRAAWKAADAAAECGGTGAGEWAKLEQEKKALDNLMQMVRCCAVRQAHPQSAMRELRRRLAAASSCAPCSCRCGACAACA
jgi:hypothetical protein